MCEMCKDAAEVQIVDLDGLRSAIGGMRDRARETPDETATRLMDENIEAVLTFLERFIEAGDNNGQPYADMSPAQRDRFAEVIAGEAMFRMDARGMAYSFALLAMRYKELLGRWSALYLATSGRADGPDIDLDDWSKSPEAKTAVTEAAKPPAPRAPGLYL